MVYNEPLGLPKGSIRAIIAISIVGAAIYKLVIGDIDPEQFLLISSVVTGFYFASKSS